MPAKGEREMIAKRGDATMQLYRAAQAATIERISEIASAESDLLAGTMEELQAALVRIKELERSVDNLKHYRDEAVFGKSVAEEQVEKLEAQLAEARRDAGGKAANPTNARVL